MPDIPKQQIVVEADDDFDDFEDEPEPVRMKQPKKAKKADLPGFRLLRQLRRDRLRDEVEKELSMLNLGD